MKQLFDTPKLVIAGDCAPKISFTIWQSGPDSFTAWVYPESMGGPENWRAIDDKYNGSPDLYHDTSKSITGCMASIMDFVNLVSLNAEAKKSRRRRKAD